MSPSPHPPTRLLSPRIGPSVPPRRTLQPCLCRDLHHARFLFLRPPPFQQQGMPEKPTALQCRIASIRNVRAFGSPASFLSPSAPASITTASKRTEGERAQCHVCGMQLSRGVGLALDLGGHDGGFRAFASDLRHHVIFEPCVEPCTQQHPHLPAGQRRLALPIEPQRRARLEFDGRPGWRDGLRLPFGTERTYHRVRQILVDQQEVTQHPSRIGSVSTFESSNVNASARCFCSGRRDGPVEESSLGVVVGERLGARADVAALHRPCGGRETPIHGLPGRFGRQRVGLVADPALGHVHLVDAVALEVVERALGPVYGDLVEVGTAEAASCVSRYEKSRPCRSGSSEKSSPGTMWLGRMPPAPSRRRSCPGCGPGPSCPPSALARAPRGSASSGRGRRRQVVRRLLVEDLQAQLQLGKSPAAIASQRSRRWKSGSAPAILTASSHSTELVPASASSGT